MNNIQSIHLSDIRVFARFKNITQKEACKILLHNACLERYGKSRRYPKEIYKIIFEDKNGDTRSITVKIVY